ncbi:MAG: YncE family protein [Bacteroidota bacterium]|nr:YncE family protein [Bacteroidota bacterium]
MKKMLIIVLVCCGAMSAFAQNAKPPLQLIQTIPLPNVAGRIDHMDVDAATMRLFIAALGNNSLEVVGLREGTVVRSFKGFSEPQGVAFVPEMQAIVVANGGDGTCMLIDGDSYDFVKSVNLHDDADNIRYDAGSKTAYVGYGNGGIAALDLGRGIVTAEAPLSGHPESFQLDDASNRMYVNVPVRHEIAVIDWDEPASVIATWHLDSLSGNFPMAMDEKGKRLFIATRDPARFVVMDTDSGKIISSVECSKDADDIYYDAEAKRIYVSCGEGFIDVFQRQGGGRYVRGERILTARGARTSLFVPSLNEFFLAVPKSGNDPAELRVYRVQSVQK